MDHDSTGMYVSSVGWSDIHCKFLSTFMGCVFPSKFMSIIHMLCVGVQSFISLQNSVKIILEWYLSLSCLNFICVQIISLYIFGISILISNSNIPKSGCIPLPFYLCGPFETVLIYSVNSILRVLLVNSVLPWCSQPIVCWLYQGRECMGWSDLTKLQRRHSAEERRKIH